MQVQRFDNPGGRTISTATGRVVHADGLVFRDLAGTGELVPWADWRLSPDERARALAAELSIQQIAGLMLYSPTRWCPTHPADRSAPPTAVRTSTLPCMPPTS
ncbi:hypothetical protein [Aestuariimicrobium ganziense]|uniref:hypothetical protein n=1 Tax=Aestuariimicrobium ganziense TaxID=2773677 RepID=UPI001941CAB2|nr:hypothetical protein [Aestuariimicrobium ganziense]